MNIDFTKLFNLQGLTDAEKAKLTASVTDLVLARMSNMIGEHLTEQEVAELEQLGENNDAAAVVYWLNEHIPNFEQGLQEELTAVAGEVNAQAGVVMNALASKQQGS